MADTKISALTDGTAGADGDIVPVARSGANRRLTLLNIANYVITKLTGFLKADGTTTGATSQTQQFTNGVGVNEVKNLSPTDTLFIGQANKYRISLDPNNNDIQILDGTGTVVLTIKDSVDGLQMATGRQVSSDTYHSTTDDEPLVAYSGSAKIYGTTDRGMKITVGGVVLQGGGLPLQLVPNGTDVIEVGGNPTYTGVFDIATTSQIEVVNGLIISVT